MSIRRPKSYSRHIPDNIFEFDPGPLRRLYPGGGYGGGGMQQGMQLKTAPFGGGGKARSMNPISNLQGPVTLQKFQFLKKMGAFKDPTLRWKPWMGRNSIRRFSGDE